MFARKILGQRVNLLIPLFLVLAIFAVELRADPYTYDFIRITSNSTEDVASQFTVEVSNYGTAADGTNQVLFTFTNSGAIAPLAALEEVYFDDGTLLGIAGLLDRDDSLDGGTTYGHSLVDFTQDSMSSVSPPDLPGGGDWFNATAGFLAEADNSTGKDAPDYRVNEDEYLGILFDLKTEDGTPVSDGGIPLTFEDVIEDLDTGALNIGIHVQSLPLGTEESDSFVTYVPLPPAMLLGSLGLGVAGYFLKRKELA